jgi:hypothetical protein
MHRRLACRVIAVTAPATTSRRLALGLGLGLGMLPIAGCTFGDDAGQKHGLTGSSTSDEEADKALLDEARTEIAGMLDLLRRTSKRYPGISTPLAGLTALHEAHDDLLAESGTPSKGTRTKVPATSTDALGLVRNRERALQAEFAGLAVQAKSGPLARLFASMAAGIAQHAQAMPDPEGPA